jgi:DNA polymerase-3 subunit beta
MTFTIINNKINSGLQMVSKVVNTKNALPILSDIIFIVEGETLILKASDSENTLITKMELASADGDGQFAVSAKDITDAMKSLPSEAELTVTVDEETHKMKVKYGQGSFSLPFDNALDFPTHPELQQDIVTEVKIQDNTLLDTIAHTILATAQDELRPVMNGLYFDLKEDGLTVVASDGHKLVRCKLENVKGDKVGSFILPKKPGNLLKNILGKSGEEVTITFDDRNIHVTAGNFTMVSRQIEGRFPNYNSVIPQNNPNILRANRLDMLSALKRISPFSNDASNLIRFHVEDNTLQFDAEDWDFSKTATEKMVAEYNGQAMSIGFKGASVIELLQNIDSDEVELRLADPSRAGLFVPSEQPEGQDFLMLMMPMLIND